MEDKLTFDEQVIYNIMLNKMKELDPKEQNKLLDILVSDLESYKVYLEMNKISNLIDNFFSEDTVMEIKLEDIEEKIAKLPDNHLLHIEDEKANEIYKNYCNKLYKFMLYENYKDRVELFNKNEVKSIVIDKLNENLENIELDTLPIEVSKIIYSYKTYNKNDLNMIKKVLSYLYVINMNSIESPILMNTIKKIDDYNKKLEELGIEEKELKGKLTCYNTKILKNRLKFYSMIGALIAIPIVGYGVGNIISKPRKIVENITCETSFPVEEIKNSASSDDDRYIDYNVLSDFVNSKRKFVTVFGDTNSKGHVEVKIYDYTDTDLSNEELKTIELDDSKIIYLSSVDSSVLINENKKGIEHLFGVYTGVAHRDISSVDFSKEYNVNFSGLGFLLFQITMLVEMYEFGTLHEQINADIIDLKKNRDLDLVKYYEILNKIKKLKEKIDLEKNKQELLGQKELYKELEENKPTGFRM